MIEKFLKPVVLLAILAAILLWYAGSRLNEAIERIDSVVAHVDSMSVLALSAKAAVDSVRKDLDTFGSYVRDIQRRVEILDLSQRVGNERFRVQRTELSRRLKELYKEIEATGKELPEIPVVDVGKKN